MADLRPWRTTELRALGDGRDSRLVAAALGRSVKAVERMAERQGLRLRRGGWRWPEATRRRVLAMRAAEGVSAREISARTGVPQRTVEKWIRQTEAA